MSLKVKTESQTLDTKIQNILNKYPEINTTNEELCNQFKSGEKKSKLELNLSFDNLIDDKSKKLIEKEFSVLFAQHVADKSISNILSSFGFGK